METIQLVLLWVALWGSVEKNKKYLKILAFEYTQANWKAMENKCSLINC